MAETITRLIGVYSVDHTLRAEVVYWVGARLGATHCALCDITHGTFRKRPEWNRCAAGLPVPFDTYHRNDQPPDVRCDSLPAVLAATGTGVVVLLGGQALESCAGSAAQLAEAIEAAVIVAGLSWPTS